MNNTTSDPAKPIGNVTIVEDFLPSPEQLVPKKKTVSVTIEISEDSIKILQQKAENLNDSYQNIIIELIDNYIKQQLENSL
ncbi:MAG: hypothetical protein EA365_00440 [Gloeocapsa sp. DLM2.Bin57]|nr:MAG: hypothetical protein EA365_00440 [Gloeocapsa sp. DLM2.Bin57]